MTFKSKIDTWLIFLLLIILITLVISLIDNLTSVTSIIILIIFIFFAYGSVFTIKYTISDDELQVSNLFVKYKYKIKEISEIEFKKNYAATIAASCDRLKIYFSDGNSIEISPRDKILFMREIKKLIISS